MGSISGIIKRNDVPIPRVQIHVLDDTWNVVNTLITANATNYSLLAYGDHIYIGSSAIRKHNIHDLSFISTPYIASAVQALVTDGTYLYAAGSTNTIRRYNLSDLEYTDVESPTYGSEIRALAISGNFIYAAGVTAQTIRKYNLGDLTYADVESPAYGNPVNTIAISGDYIYAAGEHTSTSGRRIKQYNLGTLTSTGLESPLLSWIAHKLLIYNGSIIMCGWNAQIRQYSLSDLTLERTFRYGVTSGTVFGDMVIDDGFLYVAGYITIVSPTYSIILKYSLDDADWMFARSNTIKSAGFNAVAFNGDYIFAAGTSSRFVRHTKNLTGCVITNASGEYSVPSLTNIKYYTVVSDFFGETYCRPYVNPVD